VNADNVLAGLEETAAHLIDESRHGLAGINRIVEHRLRARQQLDRFGHPGRRQRIARPDIIPETQHRIARVPALPLAHTTRSIRSPASNACDSISCAQAAYPSAPSGFEAPPGITQGRAPCARTSSASWESCQIHVGSPFSNRRNNAAIAP
jgi:hypothetical protein